MKPLNFFRCFLVFLFLSCQSDNLVYYLDGQIKAIEQQKTNTLINNQKSFSFDLNKSEDFKTYAKELTEISKIDLTIKSNVNFDNDDYFLIIENVRYSLSKFSTINNNQVEITDSDLLSIISKNLIANKHFDLVLESNDLNEEQSPIKIEMILNFEGIFLGLH